MTEVDLLHAVVADPDDLGPRLVYADHLDEVGQSERAEFIRLDIAMGQTTDYDSFGTMKRRREELIASMDAAGVPRTWRPAEGQHECDAIVKDGMTEFIRLPLRMFMRHVDELFSILPLKGVHLTDREPLPISSVELTCIWDTWEGAGPDFVDEPHLLPPELLYADRDAARADELPYPFEYVESFASPELAHAWLSRACVKIGRQRVGLTSLVQTQVG